MSFKATDDFEELEENISLPPIRNMPAAKKPTGGKRKPGHKARHLAEVKSQIAEQMERVDDFNFSYNASRHEREWIVSSLGGFYDQHWLDDVLRLIQGGKEAHVYQCLASAATTSGQESFLAAKVYRPRRFRTMKNDSIYREGREHIDSDGRIVIDDGMLHAMAKRSAWGRELLHTSWIEHEVKAMQILHQAGADVPFCYASGNNAILMTYIGDASSAAPTLNQVELDPGEARQLFQRLLHNIELMLAHHRVHGDLSAYNILYWDGQITLIDFPQSIDPDQNKDAFLILKRDIARVCDYFTRQGVRSNPLKLAQSMWSASGHRLSPEVHPSLLDPEDKKDRAYWNKVKE
jgi:RIO kinase 1